MDPYKILNVSRSATDEEIKRVYKKLALKYHPDRNPSGADQLKEINSAYEILGDPKRRKNFDEFGGISLRPGFEPDLARRFNIGPEVVINEMMTGSFTDILSKLFSKDGDAIWDRINKIHARVQATGYQTMYIAIDFMDMLKGKKLNITNGTNNIEINIHPGVKDEQKMRVMNLTIIIKVKPHPVFSRVENDIHMKLNISPGQAKTGGMLPVVTPWDTVELKIPRRTKTGQKLKIKGFGVREDGKEPGDLYAEIIVTEPTAS